MIRRREIDVWYAYPEDVPGIKGWLRRRLYDLGFDPLTIYERAEQLDTERAYWKNETKILQAKVTLHEARSGARRIGGIISRDDQDTEMDRFPDRSP